MNEEIKTYKGLRYYKDKDGLWKVIHDNNSIFIVAWDDSKMTGRKNLVEEANTENTCKKYIDFCTSEK